ncbi:MAG: ABC transporter permease [Phreatobacter sp.]|uniref:ABC transporter permease n=1 Tax=Phreatobacter sp. TaxID=1966341 RepID=UPI001A419890|nr:ABC transporter permease [Phreatobacter sp.]MBL8570282.1 ABC transporter permease [Phreatobacter sp.]
MMTDSLKTILATLTTLAVCALAWEGAIRIFALPPFVLPPLSAVGQALYQGWVVGTLYEHALFTLQGAAAGLVIGVVVAIVLGALVAEIRPLALAVYPLVIATQSMPTVAIAPLIVVYLGIGLPSKIATVALLCFFPVFVNTIVGVRGANPALVDLYRAFGASRTRIFLDVKLPGAVDSIMAGIQIAVVLAFVGCVVSEFIASPKGLGHIVKTFASDLNVSVMFAAIIGLGVLGALAAALIRAAHRALVPWRRS